MTPKNSGEQLYTRRHVVKRIMLGSAAVIGVGSFSRSRLLADISPDAPPTDILPLHLATDFQGFLDGDNSMELEISAFPEVIMINYVGFTMYVLNAKCTHMGCTVQTWNASDNILCPCHGSNYNVDGSIIRPAIPGSGQPGLATYSFNFDGVDLLQIDVPGLNLTINNIAIAAVTASNTRLHLNFPGRALSTYQVLYTPDLVTPAQQVMFALTANGAADQSSIQTNAMGGPVDVWVDDSGTQGFYSIELVYFQLFD